METTSECVPRVTKSFLKSPEKLDLSYLLEFAHFDDLETLLFIFDGFLYISFNSGENWEPVSPFREAHSIDVDRFHKRRAFVMSMGGRIHVTENQGRNWKELHIPKVAEKDLEWGSVQSHPFDKKLLFVRFDIKDKGANSFTRDIIYASDDNGETFRCIVPSVSDCEATPAFERYSLRFAASSKESTLDSKGIYCIHDATYVQKLSGIQDVVESGKRRSFKKIRTLFYTTDIGRSIRVFDELNGLLVQDIFIFPSNVLVLTSKSRHNKLWMSRGEIFEPLDLPGEVISLQNDVRVLSTKKEQLLMRVKVSDNKIRLLQLDLSNVRFAFLGRPMSWSDSIRESFGQLGNLKGTFWRRSPVEKIEGDTNPENPMQGSSKTIFQRVYVTKASFDNGKSWTNLKVVDPSGSHRHLFDGDIYDLEHCSFQESSRNGYGITGNEQTAGIIMKIGTAGKTSRSSNEDDMTFISRDGGASWEVVFEFPVLAVFLDFGNIIVAIPRENSEVYTKFFFSLNQGKTWNEHCFDEQIPALQVSIYSLGLKAIIGMKKRRASEYIFHLADFSNIFGGASCTEDDLEIWYLSNGKCIDGMKYSFTRCKADAKCLMRKTFERLELHEEKCEC